MRITYITAGAGGMYCGSCIRDNALAARLTAAGHEVLLLPLYTPLLTDEENVSSDRIFYDGISVYLEEWVPLFRHTPWLLDRLWESPQLIRAVAGRAVQTEPEGLGDLTVSVLEGTDGRQSKEIDKLVHWLRGQPRPDVVDISNSMLIALARPLKEALGAPVCCTLQGEDIFLSRLGKAHRDRCIELIAEHAQHVDRFVAVSDYCAERMCRFLGIPGAKIDVAPLGISVEGLEGPARASGNGLTIGHFGRVAPEKGLHVLCEAYRRLREAGRIARASIKVAGYLSPGHRSYLDSILEQAREWGLDGDVSYHGKLDREQKLEFLSTLDMLAVPAVYDDPKGFAAARSHGLRRAGDRAAARHLHGIRRADRRRRARAAGRRGGARSSAGAAGGRPRPPRGAGASGRGGRARALHRRGRWRNGPSTSTARSCSR